MRKEGQTAERSAAHRVATQGKRRRKHGTLDPPAVGMPEKLLSHTTPIALGAVRRKRCLSRSQPVATRVAGRRTGL